MNIRTWQWVGVSIFALGCGLVVAAGEGLITLNWDFFEGFMWAVGLCYVAVGLGIRLKSTKHATRHITWCDGVK